MKNILNCSYEKRSIRFPYSPSSMSKKMLYYIDLAGIIYTKPDYLVKRKGFDPLLICYITHGKGILKYNNMTYELVPGTLFIIDCKKEHLYKSNSKTPMEFTFFHFNGNSSQMFFDLITKNHDCIFNINPNSKTIDLLYKIIDTLKFNLPYLEELCSKYINDILTGLLIMSHENASNTPLKAKNYTFIEDIKKYIEINYASPISIDTMCKEFAISKSHLIRQFKIYVGCSPYDYLLKFRLNSAKYLLVNSDLTINEIVYKTGFGDASNFIRYFKKQNGITPKTYRTQYEPNHFY